MLFSSVSIALYAVFCIWIYNYVINNKNFKIKYNLFVPLMMTGILIRIFFAMQIKGHSTDMACFTGWAELLSKYGIKNFYQLPDFTDYPPGYMYILRILGGVIEKFDITENTLWLLIKTPAIICDILMGVIIYFLSKKNFLKQKASIIAGLYFLNPATILNSSVWGQVDAVYLLLIVLSLYFLMNKNILFSYIMFSVAVIFKPQALIFTPVLLFSSFEYLFEDKSNLKSKLIKVASSFFVALCVALVLILPFGLQNVLNQYKETLSSYNYLTVNAFNIWGLFNLNWEELTFFGSILGYLFIFVICVVSAVIYFKTKDNSKYFITSAFLSFATYMLSVKMHERYAFCAMALMLIAFLLNPKRKSYLMYLFLTISQMINTSWILFVYETNPSLYYRNVFIIIASFLNLLLLGYMSFYFLSEKESKLFTPSVVRNLEKSKKIFKITRLDIFLMIVITVIYSGVALYGLGSKVAPESGYKIETKTQIEFKNTSNIEKFCLFNNNIPIEDENFLSVNFYDDGYEKIKTIDLCDVEVFSWHFEDVELKNIKYIDIEHRGKSVTINEIAFFNENYEYIPMINTPSELLDEKETVPIRESYYNSTYFDEIYHARTGYEFINSEPVYEWTHPPLGKIFIALGIKVFGMNPFGWRITGTVFGILMLFFIYIFIKKMTNQTWISAVITFVFAFDFMHFTQTRIATIDVYVTFFVILMYLFMYIYYKKSFYDTRLFKTFLPLFLSGVFFGLGVASKWTGIYAGAGLCVIFFMTLNKRYKEYLWAMENPGFEDSKRVIKVFKKNTIKTLGFCVFAFIIIPVIIYLVSYIPYVICEGGGFDTVIKNQSDMFIYHSETVLDATHPYSSKWYEWIVMKRPIWYYSGTLENGLKEGISAFGNPLVWWVGIVAIFYMIYLSFSKKDENAIFIVTGYLAQLIPWMFVDRVVFIYHYFPSTVFLMLAIGYSIYILYNKNKRVKQYAVCYALLTVLMFGLFYPVLSGMAVDPGYVYKYLRWFESWVLI